MDGSGGASRTHLVRVIGPSLEPFQSTPHRYSTIRVSFLLRALGESYREHTAPSVSWQITAHARVWRSIGQRWAQSTHTLPEDVDGAAVLRVLAPSLPWL